MIEVEIGAISHAEPFHHRATADIAPPGDRPNFIVGQIFESPRGRAARRLARKTGAPTVAREPPADLDPVRHGTHVAANHAAPTDQPRILKIGRATCRERVLQYV